MTRKDYVAIAKVFAVQKIKDVYWERLEIGIADVFALDNERFNRERFYIACEVTP